MQNFDSLKYWLFLNATVIVLSLAHVAFLNKSLRGLLASAIVIAVSTVMVFWMLSNVVQ